MDKQQPPRIGAFMDIRLDWAFHYVMSEKAVLEKFLSDILAFPVRMIESLPNEIPVRSEKEKRATFDVVCQNRDTGEKFIVEMQRRGETDMDDRLFFYGASLIHNQVASGDDVYRLRPVYVICIADFEVPHRNAAPGQFLFHYTFTENSTGELYGKQLQFYRFELRRARLDSRWENLGNDLDRWCYLFRNFPTFAKRPAQLSGFDAVFDKAMTDQLSPEQKEEYRKDMITEYERFTITEYARQEGIQEGRQQGRQEGRQQGLQAGIRQVAARMLSQGVSADIIIQATGLSESELQELASSEDA